MNNLSSEFEYSNHVRKEQIGYCQAWAYIGHCNLQVKALTADGCEKVTNYEWVVVNALRSYNSIVAIEVNDDDTHVVYYLPRSNYSPTTSLQRSRWRKAYDNTWYDTQEAEAISVNGSRFGSW